MQRGGDLGLFGVDVPEAYGGVGLDKVSSLVVSEKMAASASFGATFGAHANLTVVPLVLFGSEAQKQKYLPKLLAGQLIGAYGLSETGSGSDALGARTRAVRQADGSFLLNGEKMWITNGGFADLFVVFAKVDGRAVHRLPRGARVWRQERQGRAQDGPPRLVDDRADFPGRESAGRQRPR